MTDQGPAQPMNECPGDDDKKEAGAPNRQASKDGMHVVTGTNVGHPAKDKQPPVMRYLR